MLSVTDRAPSIRPLHGDFGVQIAGLDLRGNLAPGALELIHEALRRHRLVVFPDQRLDESAQLGVAGSLGIVVASTSRSGHRCVPDVRYQSDVGCVGPPPRHVFYNQQWHADMSWTAQGAPVTLLYAVEADPGCASTAFADMIGAYDSLDETTRATIESWQAFHHVACARELRYGQPVCRRQHAQGAAAGVTRGRIATALRRFAALIDGLRSPRSRLRTVPPQRVDRPGALHPVVQTDPASGRRFVHLGDHAWSLAGIDEVEGRASVDELNRRVITDGNVHQHRWSAGDLVLLDNRSVLHRRSPDGDDNARRVLRRCGVWRRGA